LNLQRCISDEKDLIGLYCMDNYFREQTDRVLPYAFRRQQSRLYQKLHPDPVSLKWFCTLLFSKIDQFIWVWLYGAHHQFVCVTNRFYTMYSMNTQTGSHSIL